MSKVKNTSGFEIDFDAAVNLMDDELREHTALFGKPPGDRSAGQIAQGFYSAYMAQRNVGEHHTLTYKDWKLLAVKTIKK